MKRLCFLFIFLILFMICTPVFSLAASAPFTYNTSLSMPTLASNQWGFVFASDDSNGLYAILECDAIPYYVEGRGFSPNLSSDYPGAILNLSQSFAGNIILSLYDLDHGYLLTTETKYISNTSYINVIFFRSADIKISSHLSTPAYCYPLGSSVLTDSSSSYPLVDPFVNWNYNPSPDPPSPPVDPTEVIRSRIPRPYGNASTMYIADHLYLYAIYMGVPHQFEEQGLIQTSLDPAKYAGDNYNIYDVSFTSSGSDLNMVITNRAQFSYNVIVSKYDVVDGSYVSSDIRAVTIATDAEHPSTNNLTISLSDPATYGIYQSGFFARSQIIAYPELRISWSDTIDYSLDFFVIRQGLVTIVDGINSTNSALSTANSTLSNISSISSQILSSINTFYTLCSGYFDWFKTTYYNTILNRWDINKTQLDTIISLLQGNGETTYPENESVSDSVDNFVSQEDIYFSNFDSAGNDIEGVFDEAISQFSDNSHGFGFIKMLLETFVFNLPSSYIIVFVSLTFGLIVMIIGRVVGGKT